MSVRLVPGSTCDREHGRRTGGTHPRARPLRLRFGPHPSARGALTRCLWEAPVEPTHRAISRNADSIDRFSRVTTSSARRSRRLIQANSERSRGSKRGARPDRVEQRSRRPPWGTEARLGPESVGRTHPADHPRELGSPSSREPHERGRYRGYDRTFPRRLPDGPKVRKAGPSHPDDAEAGVAGPRGWRP